PGTIYWDRLRPNFYDTKLTDAQKAMLAPLDEDHAAFADFLRQENTGIFRLHPKGKYEPGMTISAKQAERDLILPIMGGRCYYSFTEKTNKRGRWSEICLDGNQLLAGVTPKSIGLLTELGDVPLADATLATPGVGYLAKLTAPKAYADVTALIKKCLNGFTA